MAHPRSAPGAPPRGGAVSGPAKPDPRRPLGYPALGAFVILAALAFFAFIALGAWQVQRLAWKEDLIARVERQVHAAPVAAPGPQAWPTLTREHDEYRRVELSGLYDTAQETLVRAATELGTGYWVMTPLQTDDGFTVLVNRGFVPSKDTPRFPCRPERSEGSSCTARFTALLRLTEPHGSPLQRNEPAAQRWYSRDVAAIAAARHLGPVAPYFVDVGAEATPPSGWPRAGLTVVRFSNNHRVYAITWFALAALSACAIGYLVIDERRLRRLAGDPSLAHA
jgi:surfeit locus 1 family protein